VILFRCEVSDQIGWGHLKRCLSLAKILHKHTPAIFVSSSEDARVLDAILQAGSRIHRVPAGLSYKDEVKYYPKLHKNIIVDLGHQRNLAKPGEFIKYLTELNLLGYQVALIDGLGAESFRCKGAPRLKVYIQPYWGVEEKPAPNSEHWLYGPKYAFVDEIYQHGFKKRSTGTVKNILITFGGSDPQENTLKVLTGVLGLCDDFIYRVIVGPSFCAEQIEKIQQLGLKYSLELIVAPDDLLNHYHWADLGICGSGTSRYEAAATGLPVIFTSIYKEHDRLSARFASYGTARYIGPAADLSSDDWFNSIKAIQTFPEIHDAMITSLVRMRQVIPGGEVLAAELFEVFDI